MPTEDADELATRPGLLSDHWGITGVSVVECLQTSSTRRVERVVSDQGRFAVKVDAAPDPLVEGSEQVQRAIARALPRHAPTIVPNVAGVLYDMDQGRRVSVHEDIGGGRPDSCTQTWSDLGAILARLHGLPPVRRSFAIPVQAAANELDWQADDYPFADRFRSLTRRVREIGEHPAATIHGEINLSNVRQRPNGELVLLDWDAAGTGPIAIDLGYPLICVFYDGPWYADHAFAFYAAYARNATTVPAAEQVFNAAVMHAMRYVRFADTAGRWARMQDALAHEATIMDLLTTALAPRL